MTAKMLLDEMQSRGFDLSPTGEGIRVIPFSLLTDTDREAIRNHKNELLDLLGKKSLPPPSPEHCPRCNDQLIMQDRKLDAWFCASCRKWFDGAGKSFRSPERTNTQLESTEEIDARDLFENFKRAGCGFVYDGEELRITNLERADNGLLARLDTAGAEFRRLALREATDDRT
jgi:hypothetical protein